MMEDSPPQLSKGMRGVGSQYGFVGESAERNDRAQEWELHDSKGSTYPYLAHIKAHSSTWRTLQHLADWMQVGTSPSRWTNEYKKDGEERARRRAKTNLAFVEYTGEKATPNVMQIKDAGTLKEVLSSFPTVPTEHKPLRLFVVEDLSQEVIEQLGSRFDIDPLFFREQIEDYVWHNLGAVSAAPAPLLVDMKNRNWFRVRNFRLRHHEEESSFRAARGETRGWNVSRRLDDDMNHWGWAGEDTAIVSMLRTRTTIWVGADARCDNTPVAVILLDPTVRNGKPLWYDRANWLPVPSMTSTFSPHPPTSSSWYTTILTLTRLYPWFESTSPSPLSPHVIAKPALYTIAAEWLLVADYVKGRLSQIERELELPHIFRTRSDTIDASLARLHTWRRALPTFIEMLQETLEFGLPAASRLTNPLQRSGTGGFDRGSDPFAGYEDIAPDFQRTLGVFTSLMDRVDRLSNVVAAEISIEDSRRGLEDSRRANREAHNMARVTWLATVFIPATFVSGLYSMNESVVELKQTYWIYFVTAVPVTLFVMGVAWVVGGGSLVPWRVSVEEGGWRKDGGGKGRGKEKRKVG